MRRCLAVLLLVTAILSLASSEGYMYWNLLQDEANIHYVGLRMVFLDHVELSDPFLHYSLRGSCNETTGILEQRVRAREREIEDYLEMRPTYTYTFDLVKLCPACAVHYGVPDTDSVRCVITPPDQGAIASRLLTIAFVADLGGTSYTSQVASIMARSLPFRVPTAAPAVNFSLPPIDLVVLGGDLAYASIVYQGWRKFDRALGVLAPYAPFAVATGNHDLYKELEIDSLFARFPAVRNAGNTVRQDVALYYSFDYGCIHVIVLSTGSNATDRFAYADIRVAQRAWLEADLKQTVTQWERLLWTVVVVHEPPYATNKHGSSLALRQDIEDLLLGYHVDIVLSGHNHAYERSHPISNGTTDTGEVHNNRTTYYSPQGPIYVVVGTGGKGVVNKFHQRESWTAHRERSSYGYVHAAFRQMNGTHTRGNTLALDLAYVRTDGKLVDLLTVYKHRPTLCGGTLSYLEMVAAPTICLLLAIGCLYRLRKRRRPAGP